MIRLTDKIKTLKRQRGLFVVEFAIVGAVFLITLFMVIEFGRLLFTWNVLDEITRRGARLAAVCPVNSAGIFKRSTLQNEAGEPLVNITGEQLVIEYLDSDGDEIDPPAVQDDAANGTIQFVRARIDEYSYEAIFPMNLVFQAPAFETTLPAESLGVMPPDTGVTKC